MVYVDYHYVNVNHFITVAIELPLWCWEKEVLEVTVDRIIKPTALNFIQVGFRLEIAVPINVTIVSCPLFNLLVKF